QVEEVADPGATKAPDYVPSFDADVAGVLPHPRQRANLFEAIRAAPADSAPYPQCPVLQVHAGIDNVVVVVRELVEGNNVRIGKDRCEVAFPEQQARRGVAGGDPAVQQRLLPGGYRKGAEQKDGTELE